MGERSMRETVKQLRAECRRSTELQARAERAELAERNLAAELQRAHEKIIALEHQIGMFDAIPQNAKATHRARAQ